MFTTIRDDTWNVFNMQHTDFENIVQTPLVVVLTKDQKAHLHR